MKPEEILYRKLANKNSEIIIEALINVLIIKGVINDSQEFLDVIEAIEVGEELTKK